MILVVGATGILGGMITRGLLEGGKEVRILLKRDSPSEGLMAETARRYGVELTNLEDYVRGQFGARPKGNLETHSA